MRHILTSVVLLVLLFPALAMGKTINAEDLVKTDGLYYKKFTDVPFTGKVIGKEQGYLIKGKWDGPYITYYDNGRISSKHNYKDGVPDGPWVSYHENGQLSSKHNYKDGKLEGPWVSYHENGQLSSKGAYKDG